MKKTILVSASILCLSACSLFGNGLKNTPPTDIKVELSVGWSNKETGLIEVVDKDVYINTYKKDTYNNSYFAHFDDGSYDMVDVDNRIYLTDGDWNLLDFNRIGDINEPKSISFNSNYNNSYFAHFDDGSYVYYRKDVLNNGDWESYVPTTADSKKMTTLDVINSFVGTISNVYADIFDVELANYAQPSGTGKVLGIDTTIYKANNKTYWYLDGVNMFLKVDDDSKEESSCTVTHYQYYKHFDDSPNL